MSSDCPGGRQPRFYAGRFLVFCIGVGATIFAANLVESWIIKGHDLTANPSAAFATVVVITNFMVILVGIPLFRPWIWGTRK